MSGELSHSVSNVIRKSLPLLGVTKASKILVGVSGGMDSMVLLYILHKSGYAVSAGHVNFNLREGESINDALFVRNWCLDQDIPYVELSKDTKAFAKANRLNTQTAARTIRYEWWEYLVRTQQFDFVATAHHLDDTIETIFLNLFRGTGLKGLRGIPPARDFYIRPLLECSRAEITSYAEAFQIPYRTDESNLTDHYQRNKLRHHLIPLLEELNPGFHSSMKHTLHRINIEWLAWEQSYEEWQAASIQRLGDGSLIEGERSKWPFILRWLEERGFPWSLAYDFLASPKADSGHILEYEGYRLSRTEKGYFLEETQPGLHIILHKPGTYTFGNFRFSIDPIPAESFTKGKDQWTEYVSESCIRWPLSLRNFKAGDHFQPFGMQGRSKKVQDLMVDHKLEHYEKERLLLVTNEDHIIWVIGLRLDERGKVTPTDKIIYRLTYTELQSH